MPPIIFYYKDKEFIAFASRRVALMKHWINQVLVLLLLLSRFPCIYFGGVGGIRTRVFIISAIRL
jgi:hypothetical protein